LFGDISATLPDHTGEFYPADVGPLSDTGGKTYQSQHGLGQWVAPHLDIQTRQDGFVHGAFRTDGWGMEPVPRGFQAVRIIKVGRARPVTVAHFYGLRDIDGKGDTPVRADQAKRALTLLSQIASPQDDIVFAGDFNVLPDSEALAIFADWGLRDLVGQQDTRTSLYPKAIRQANYMPVTASVEVKSFKVPADRVVSDHRTLILSIA
jgi:exonuclease III